MQVSYLHKHKPAGNTPAAPKGMPAADSPAARLVDHHLVELGAIDILP